MAQHLEGEWESYEYDNSHCPNGRETSAVYADVSPREEYFEEEKPRSGFFAGSGTVITTFPTASVVVQVTAGKSRGHAIAPWVSGVWVTPDADPETLGAILDRALPR